MICDTKPPSAPPSAPPPLPPQSPAGSARDAVVRAALAEVGNGDPAKYWADVLPNTNVGHADWCGAFALWALHQAGLALDRKWVIGKGFILVGPHPLPTTATPLPGDIAYFNHNQHQAIVSVVRGDVIELVNGNGEHGKVSTSTITRKQATAFFSIAPLLRQPSGNA